MGDRATNLENVVVHEEENSGNKAYEDVHLDDADKGDLSKIGSIKASVTSKAKSM